jgi:hypothetical protein
MKMSETFNVNKDTLDKAIESTEAAFAALVGEAARGAGKARQFAGDLSDIYNALTALKDLEESLKPRAAKKKPAVK